jgi:phosphohistidine phosphatase
MAARLQLLLLRHSDAGDPAAWTHPDDERPLSEKGRLQAERLGRLLAATDNRPDAVVTSPLVRAGQTAELVAAELVIPVQVDDRLAPGFGASDLVGVLRRAGDPRRPMLVGHDPDFSELASLLTGTDVAMKKGALARIDLDGPFEAGMGRLRWLLPPDLLDPSR